MPDNIDPTPTQPGVTCGFLDQYTRDLADDIEAMSLNLFTAPNNNAREGLRNSLASRVRNAANAICDHQCATPLLHAVLERVNGASPPPDWMVDSSSKTDVANRLRRLLVLLDR